MPHLLSRRLLAGLLAAACGLLPPAPARAQVPPAPAPASDAPALTEEALLAVLRQGRERHARAAARLQAATEAMRDVPLAKGNAALNLAKMALDTANLLILTRAYHEARAWLGKASDYTDEALWSSYASRGAETRGILIDAGALPKTEREVVALVDRLADAGFNVLVPEVYRRGYTVWDSPRTERDPEFAGAPDVLGALIARAHARGLEVHPWLWTLRARSVSPTASFGNPILDKLPALGARAEGKPTRFLAASEPLARRFVFDLVGELQRRYAIDGLLLDYIRYDEEIPEDEISRTRFGLDYFAKHGAYPPWPIPKRSALEVEWQLWRERQVHSVVAEIARMTKAKNPRFALSVAVFRGEAYARLVKMQHWRHWANNRWIDAAAPMLYTAKKEDLRRWLDWETDQHRRANLLTPILGAHRFEHLDNLFDQWELLQEEGHAGGMLFALSHVKPETFRALRLASFREDAMTPQKSPARAARVVLAQAAGYCRNVFALGDYEAAASARLAEAEVLAVAAMLPLTEAPFTKGSAALARLEALQALMTETPWPPAVRAELTGRLAYAQALLRAHVWAATKPKNGVGTSLPPIKIEAEQLKGPQD